jgi:hypothetical protein
MEDEEDESWAERWSEVLASNPILTLSAQDLDKIISSSFHLVSATYRAQSALFCLSGADTEARSHTDASFEASQQAQKLLNDLMTAITRGGNSAER